MKHLKIKHFIFMILKQKLIINWEFGSKINKMILNINYVLI